MNWVYQRSNALVCINTVTRKWTNVQQLASTVPEHRCWHSAGALGTKMLILGGSDRHENALNDVHVFDTVTSSWVKFVITGSPPSKRIYHTCSVVGRQVFISGGEDESYVPFRDDNLYVLTLEDEDEIIITPDTISDDFLSLLNNKDLADITFLCEGKDIYAHKLILSARCERFRAMFSSGMQESSLNVIQVPQKYPIFYLLLEFIYSGKATITVDNSIDLLKLADEYHLVQLKERCERFISYNLDLDNVCSILSLADLYKSHQLRELCIKFIVKEFEGIKDSNTFKELSSDLVGEIKKRM